MVARAQACCLNTFPWEIINKLEPVVLTSKVQVNIHHHLPASDNRISHFSFKPVGECSNYQAITFSIVDELTIIIIKMLH